MAPVDTQFAPLLNSKCLGQYYIYGWKFALYVGPSWAHTNQLGIILIDKKARAIEGACTLSLSLSLKRGWISPFLREITQLKNTQEPKHCLNIETLTGIPYGWLVLFNAQLLFMVLWGRQLPKKRKLRMELINYYSINSVPDHLSLLFVQTVTLWRHFLIYILQLLYKE